MVFPLTDLIAQDAYYARIGDLILDFIGIGLVRLQ